MGIEDIILENSKLGIETIFYNDNEGPLGYVYGNTIYLNDFYDDLELVNKHEILHFFDNSKQFKGIKKIIFKLLGEEEIDRLRSYYYVKYYGLYSEEEIEKGILDDEIAIDVIIGNGEFSININDYISNAFDTIVYGKENVRVFDSAKKYLNLSVSNKIKQQYMELTKWEKIFVINFYSKKENMIPTDKKNKYMEIRNTIDEELEKLYGLCDSVDYFTISTSSEELVREYMSQISILIKEGKNDEATYLKENKEKILKQMADKYTKSLHAEYKHLVELIKNTSYEPAFKYLMLNETLTKIYRRLNVDGDVNNVVEKRIMNQSIKSHMAFNEIVLGVIYNNLEDYSNFANLYYAGLSLLKKSVYTRNGITLEGVSTFGKGKWIRFEGKRNNPKLYIKRVQELSSLVQDTPWCTKQQASLHLEEGDFYLFVDFDNKPHIGVKLIGNRIDEVRGIKNDNAQELEEEYRDVALEFLTKNKKIRFGKEWLEKEEWNKRLLEYCKKIDDKTLRKEDIISMVYDLTEITDYKPHYAQSGARKELLSRIQKIKVIKKLLAKKYKCSIKEVFVGDIDESCIKNSKFPYSVVLGNVTLSNCTGTDFSKLKIVLGNLNISNSNINSFDNLELVWGSASFSKFNSTGIDNLRVIGELAQFFQTNIKSMKSLERIGCSAGFIYSKIDDLSNLTTIGEEMRFDNSYIGDLSSLKIIHGDGHFYSGSIEKIGDFCCEGKVSGFMKNNTTKKQNSRR